jgi:hypothetical protein
MPFIEHEMAGIGPWQGDILASTPRCQISKFDEIGEDSIDMGNYCGPANCPHPSSWNLVSPRFAQECFNADFPGIEVRVKDTKVSSPRSVPDNYVSSNSSWTSIHSVIKPLDSYLASVGRHEQILPGLPREVLPEALECSRDDPVSNAFVPANYHRLARDPAATGTMLEQWCAQAKSHETVAFGLRESEVRDVPCLLPTEESNTEASTGKIHASSTSDTSPCSRRAISPNARLSPDQFLSIKTPRLDEELEDGISVKTELYLDLTKALIKRRSVGQPRTLKTPRLRKR